MKPLSQSPKTDKAPAGTYIAHPDQGCNIYYSPHKWNCANTAIRTRFAEWTYVAPENEPPRCPQSPGEYDYWTGEQWEGETV